METNREVGAAPHHHISEPVPADDLDLDAVERELHEVEATLARLDDGSYWADQETRSLDEVAPSAEIQPPTPATTPTERPAPTPDLQWPVEGRTERNTLQ